MRRSNSFIRCVALLMAIMLPTAFVEGATGQFLVAHRGASFDAPENTLAAFELAWQQGADAVEGDFWLTADKRIACIHDENAKRVGGDEVRIAEASLHQLKQLDVGSWKDARFAGAKVPTLQQVLKTIPDGKQIYIEIKCGPEILPQLQRVLKATPLQREQLVVISFNRDVVRLSKQLMPELKSYWISRAPEASKSKQEQPTLDELVATAVEIKADGLSLGINAKSLPTILQEVDAEFVAKCHAQGIGLHAWTIDDPQLGQQLSDLGFRSITTNRPQLLRSHQKGPVEGVRVGESDEAVQPQSDSATPGTDPAATGR